MSNYKGFSEASSEVNPVLDPGRYYGVVDKVTEADWNNPKYPEGKILNIQYRIEGTVDGNEMPTWASDKGVVVFERLYIPNDDSSWADIPLRKLKNLYVACGVTDVDEPDPEGDLPGKTCFAVVGIDSGGVKEKANGDKFFAAKSNTLKEFMPEED